MKKWASGGAVLLGSLLVAALAQARTLQVGPGGYSTIEAALRAAGSGDVVQVAPGTYREALFLKNGVTLRGAGPQRTTVEGPPEKNVLYAQGVSGARVEGLRLIYRGNEPHAGVLLVDSRLEMQEVDVSGATLSGVEVKGSSEVTISGSRIHDNKQTGAFAHAGARLTVLRSRLFKNGFHGATAGKDAQLTLRQNRIEDNQKAGIVAYEKGRVEAVSNFILRNQTIGVDIFEEARALLRLNVIAKNKLHGLRVGSGATATVAFNTVVDNGEVGLWAKVGAGVTFTSNIVVGNKWGISDDKNTGPRPALRNNLVWENRWNYDPSTLRPGPVDLSADPRFADRAGGNYRLLAGSPAIGRGDDGRDLGAWRFRPLVAGPVAGRCDDRASGGNALRSGALPHDFNGADTGDLDCAAGDQTDWWKLSVREPGQMLFRLENLSGSGDIDMEVYRGNEGAPRGTSRRAGTTTEEASLSVEPGLYYIRVWQPSASGKVRYRLSNSFTPGRPAETAFLDPERNSGSNRLRSGALPHDFNGSDTGDVDYNGGDRTDWWKLPIPRPGQATFRLENQSGTGDINMEIYRENEATPLAAATRVGTATEEASLQVKPGTYYIRVWAPNPSGKIRYKLSNRFTERAPAVASPVVPPRPAAPAPPAPLPGDIQGPKIEVSYPDRSPMSVSEKELVVTGLLRDPSGIARVRVLLNGRDLPSTARTGVQGALDAQTQAGRYPRDFDLTVLIPLRRGTNIVIITAWDRADNASKKVLQVSYEPEGRPGQEQQTVRREAVQWKSAGSGFLIGGTSHILTSLHVVEGATTIRVSFPSGESFTGRVVARDANNDLAVVHVQGMPARSKGFKVELGAKAEVGEEVLALGYPLGPALSRKPSMVSGQVSSETGPRDNIAQFRMTAPINEGNSGGPVLNSKGVLVGIASAGMVRQGVEAVRFGTKISAAALILGQIGLVKRFDVGVAPAREKPYAPQELFREFSPYVALIETR